mmetsp:Transcript_19904/g.27615  ORF Transcript_19904/g.27615 Transcript_19904/m.27615 type:complete len:238 (-) Transcript_19904:116-829(-)
MMNHYFSGTANMNRSKKAIHPTEAHSSLSIAMENQLGEEKIVHFSSESHEVAFQTTPAFGTTMSKMEHLGRIEQPPSTLVGALLCEERSATVTPSPAVEVPTIASDIEHMESQRASPMPDLSVSPLTASSYQVMEREYTRDTWRMYNRIANATIRDHRNIHDEDVARSLPTDNAFLASQIDRDQYNRSMPQPELSDSWGHYVEAEVSDSHVPEEEEPVRTIEGDEQDLVQDLFDLEL